jgi:hypothetical protein
MENSELKWVVTYNQKIEKDKLLIDWNNSKGKLSKSNPFWNKLEKFLFYSEI